MLDNGIEPMVQLHQNGPKKELKPKNKVIQITKISTYPKTRVLKVTIRKRVQLNKKNCDLGKNMNLYELKLKNKVIQITKNSTYPKTRALKVT